jgi:predicted secreted protein
MTQAYQWQDIVTTFINAAGVSNTVAEITTVPAPQFSADDIEVTSMDSGGIKEFISGLKEGNEIEFIMNDVPTDPGQQALQAAADAFENGTIMIYVPKVAKSVTFACVVKTFDWMGDNGVARNSCKVKVSGKPVKGTSVVQLSALTTTAGTLFPTFAAGTYVYTVAALHATATCTVTPTSAGATILVNGTAVTSGEASGNIALTDAGITQIDIIVKKDAKTPTAYKIYVSRAGA